MAIFGKKKQQAQVAQGEQVVQEVQVTEYENLMAEAGYDNIMVEGELVEEEDDQDYVLVRPGERPASLEGLNIAIHPVESSVTVSLEPEIVYVEENLDEGDEDVKAPRLAKMPHLVDYVMAMKISRAMKIRVAMLMIQAYNVFKNSPDNKAIVIQCLTKIIKAIMADKMAQKQAEEKVAVETVVASVK